MLVELSSAVAVSLREVAGTLYPAFQKMELVLVFSNSDIAPGRQNWNMFLSILFISLYMFKCFFFFFF